MSGTDFGYAATRKAGWLLSIVDQVVAADQYPIISYEYLAILLLVSDTLPIHLRTIPAIALRNSYAMSGTDIASGGLPALRRVSVCCYAMFCNGLGYDAMPYPVLRKRIMTRMVLPGEVLVRDEDPTSWYAMSGTAIVYGVLSAL
eukprot:3448291-Rhodomonas_salina.2